MWHYEDTNLYNDMGLTKVLQREGDLWGHFWCPRNSKGLKTYEMVFFIYLYIYIYIYIYIYNYFFYYYFFFKSKNAESFLWGVGLGVGLV